MFVLGAPEELEALVGLFGKLYVYTLDCASFYSLFVAQIFSRDLGAIKSVGIESRDIELSKKSNDSL